MAMTDYGSVVKKNDKIIQTEMFMDMKDAVGFTIDKIPYSYYSSYSNEVRNCTINIDGEFFSYIGDRELLLCIYKGSIYFISNEEIVRIQRDLWLNYDLPYELQKLEFTINGVNFRIKRLAKNKHRYKLRFSYKGDLYEVLYGYGVAAKKDYWSDVSPKEQRYIDNWFNCSHS